MRKKIIPGDSAEEFVDNQSSKFEAEVEDPKNWANRIQKVANFLSMIKTKFLVLIKFTKDFSIATKKLILRLKDAFTVEEKNVKLYLWLIMFMGLSLGCVINLLITSNTLFFSTFWTETNSPYTNKAIFTVIVGLVVSGLIYYVTYPLRYEGDAREDITFTPDFITWVNLAAPSGFMSIPFYWFGDWFSLWINVTPGWQEKGVTFLVAFILSLVALYVVGPLISFVIMKGSAKTGKGKLMFYLVQKYSIADREAGFIAVTGATLQANLSKGTLYMTPVGIIRFVDIFSIQPNRKEYDGPGLISFASKSVNKKGEELISAGSFTIPAKEYTISCYEMYERNLIVSGLNTGEKGEGFKKEQEEKIGELLNHYASLYARDQICYTEREGMSGLLTRQVHTDVLRFEFTLKDAFGIQEEFLRVPDSPAVISSTQHIIVSCSHSKAAKDLIKEQVALRVDGQKGALLDGEISRSKAMTDGATNLRVLDKNAYYGKISNEAGEGPLVPTEVAEADVKYSSYERIADKWFPILLAAVTAFAKSKEPEQKE